MLNKLLIITIILSFSSLSFAEDYSEGFEYKIIKPALPTHSPKGTIEVREIFWYGCPHCYTLENVLKKWKHPKYVDFKFTPAIAPNGWAGIGAQTYYTAEMLGITQKIHDNIFEAIHKNRNYKLIDNIKEIAKFFAKFGIKQNKFYDAWYSFAVDLKLKQATRTFIRSGISGVPAIIINGKYITSPSMVASSTEVIKVIEFLVKKELGKK